MLAGAKHFNLFVRSVNCEIKKFYNFVCRRLMINGVRISHKKLNPREIWELDSKTL